MSLMNEVSLCQSHSPVSIGFLCLAAASLSHPGTWNKSPNPPASIHLM